MKRKAASVSEKALAGHVCDASSMSRSAEMAGRTTVKPETKYSYRRVRRPGRNRGGGGGRGQADYAQNLGHGQRKDEAHLGPEALELLGPLSPQPLHARLSRLLATHGALDGGHLLRQGDRAAFEAVCGVERHGHGRRGDGRGF